MTRSQPSIKNKTENILFCRYILLCN